MSEIGVANRSAFARACVVLVALMAIGLLDVAPAAGQVADGECAGEPATIVGTAGDDTIEGTDGRDVIDAGAGNDLIFGLDGDDDVCGGDGDDILFGEAGTDFMRGGDGHDVLFGGAGDDYLQGDAAQQSGAGGDDELYGEEGSDQLGGGPGRNLLDGGEGPEGTPFTEDSDWAIYLLADTPVFADLEQGVGEGEWGSDRLVGLENIAGGLADDVLSGSSGSDGLVGNGGDDTLSGRGGMDSLNGDGLVEQLAELGHEPGNDVLDGGPGVDAASWRGSFYPVFVDLERGVAEEEVGDGQAPPRTDQLSGIESLEGSDYADFLVGDDNSNYFFGGAGEDAILGGGGFDTVTGGAGDDLMFGGEGLDIVYYAGEGTPGITADLAAGTVTGAGQDEVHQFEAVVGTESGDVILGTSGVDYLFAGPGDDFLDGGGGLDLVSFYTSPGPVQGSLGSGSFITQLPGGGTETDTLANIEGLEGSPFDDVFQGTGASEALMGSGGSDTLRGGGGDDWFVGDGLVLDVADPRSNDVIVGGPGGFDLVSYAESDYAINLDLRAGGATGEGSDDIRGVEAVRGSSLHDVLKGSGARNLLFGLGGHDQLVGRGRRDELVGGAGRDTLLGGRGKDLCVGGQTVKSCAEFAKPRNHPLFSVFAEWERHRFRRRLRLLARLRR